MTTSITTNSATISKEVIDGTAYYSTERRGVSYTAYFCEVVGAWSVCSRRNSLGASNIGGCKYYDDLADCKAFAALPALISMGAI